jgi:two-component system phosphate regulon sensor histidine kinase PhoR
MRQKKTWVYLFVPTTVILLLAIAAFTAVSVFALRDTAHRQTESNLRQFSHAIASLMDTDESLRDPAKLRKFCATVGAEPGFRFTLIAGDGTVIADSIADPARLENHASRPEVAAALQGKEKAIIRFSDSLDRRMVYYAIPYHGEVIRLAVAIDYIDTASRRMTLTLVLAALFIILVSAGIYLAVSAQFVAPLRSIGSAVHAFAGGNLDAHFAKERYPLELAVLADDFSLMAADLQKKMETLDGQNRETDAILASMNDALIVLDGACRVRRVNRAAETLFALSGAHVVGMPLIQAIRNTDIADFATNPAEGECERTIELRDTKDASRYILAKSSAIGGSHERLLVFSDITRLKRLERIRKDFVANVSHELKTPITSIQGFIETLKDGAIDDPIPARRFLDIMNQQSSRLGAIIEDLLTVSRLEQDERGSIKREDAKIEEIMLNVKNLCEEEALKKKTKLEFDCPEGLTFSVNPGLIEQALTNLVLNAIKYSPEGATVRASAAVESGRFVCKVSDNGIGIPEKDLTRIFERFYRVDKGRSRDLGGTGLGLSIVRHIALVHGGTASVESTEGVGSTFTIDIPA